MSLAAIQLTYIFIAPYVRRGDALLSVLSICCVATDFRLTENCIEYLFSFDFSFGSFGWRCHDCDETVEI